MIKVGDQVPAADITLANSSEHQTVKASEYFANKKVVLFALPGAFTPTCSAAHLPGFVVNADKIKDMGCDEIACLSVNDAFVMQAWGEQQNAEAISMIADGAGAFTSAVGLELDTQGFGGVRSQRYGMVIENGVVTALSVEEAGQLEVSSAESMMALL